MYGVWTDEQGRERKDYSFLIGRHKRWPIKGKVIIGEWGIEGILYNRNRDPKWGNAGWLHFPELWPAERYANEYVACVRDASPNVIGICPFISDYADHRWQTADLMPAYGEFLARKQLCELEDVVQPSPRPVATHIPAVGTGSPSATPVPPLAHPLGNSARRVVTQGFGDNPQDYARFGLAGHNGVDYAVPSGTPIGAVDSGVVLESRLDADGYGEYIKLRHSWGESLYAHLSARKVDVGEPVNRGSIIGRSGNTGNSTGPHLHFAMRVNPYTRGAPFDGFVDPAPYLDAAQPTPQPTVDVLEAIEEAANEFGIEWQLLASQAWAESSFDPKAISRAGAKGLFQIMPATWDEWAPKVGASNPFDAVDSARVGAAYMQWLLQQTQGNAWRALVAYGWGIGNVITGEVPPATWIHYANKVVHGRDLLKAVEASQ